MSREDFIEALVRLLIRLDCGMLEFERPVPEGVREGIENAVVSFGHEAVATLHQALSDDATDSDPSSIVDALARIGEPESAKHIIEFHKEHSSYISGLTSVNALRVLRSEDGYLYLADLLRRASDGDSTGFNSGTEIIVACKALGEWNDIRAVPPLKKVLQLSDIPGLAETAILALVVYPEAHPFLKELASSEPLFSGVIESSFRASQT